MRVKFFFDIFKHSTHQFFYDNVLNSLLILTRILDFTVDEGQLIVTIAADFADPSVHTDTFFKFVQGTKEIGGVGVPKPNGYSEDLFSLWGANSFADHLPNSIGFDFNTADLGLDLVVRWASLPPVSIPEPGSVVLMVLGLLGLGLTCLKRRSVAM